MDACVHQGPHDRCLSLEALWVSRLVRRGIVRRWLIAVCLLAWTVVIIFGGWHWGRAQGGLAGVRSAGDHAG